MKTILSLVVASFLIVTGADAKAGSSGGTSRSSGSFTKSSSSYGTTSSGTATKQTSFTGSSSSSTPVTSSTTSTRPTTPAATTVPSSSTSSTHSQPVTTSSGSNTHTIIERDSGPGLGTTILGTMAGAAAGTIIGNAISNPSHSSTSVAQPVQPMVQSPVTSTNHQPQTTVATSNSSSSFSFFGLLFNVLLLVGGFYLGRKLYYYWKGRKAMFNPLEAELHVPVLTQIYTLVQLATGHLDSTAKQVLANNCTNEMYKWLTNTVSENKERGCVNVITDVEPIDTTIRSCEQIDGKLYISLKVTAQMRDYWTDLRGGILDGSSTDLVTTTDVFTFVSTDGGKKWLLSAIEEYETKSME